MGAIRDVLNLAEPKELGGSNEKKGESRSTHVDGSGLKELVVDVTVSLVYNTSEAPLTLLSVVLLLRRYLSNMSRPRMMELCRSAALLLL